MSDAGFFDKVPEVVESEDIGDLYDFYDKYVDHVKAECRRKR